MGFTRLKATEVGLPYRGPPSSAFARTLFLWIGFPRLF